MATRMQQRRGTVGQWTDANPILNIGEIGFESDTNKFKIGDGINHWDDLPYFLDEETIATSLDGYIPDSLLGAANGVAQLNSSGKLVSDQIPNVDEITQDAINTALVAGTGLDKTYNDNANTITLDIDSTVATKTYVDDAVAAVDLSSKQDVVSGVSSTEIGYLDGVTSAIQTQLDAKQAVVSGVSNTEIGYLDGVTSAIQTQIDSKAPTSTTVTLTGTQTLTNKTLNNPTINVVVEPVNDSFQLYASTVTYPYSGNQNSISIEGYSQQLPSTFVEDGPVAASQATITSPAGLSGYTFSVNAIYISNFAQPSSATLTLNNPTTESTAALASWAASSIESNVTVAYVISGATTSVASAEIGYLDGVTSAIQDQLDDKAPLAGPTFTGTVTTDDLVVDGDFTVNGTNFSASATSITIEDNLVQIAHNNPANTVDLGLVVGYNDGTAKHAGLVKDTSASTWKLFKGVTTEPATTVDFTEGSLDDLAVAGLTASSLTVGDVSNTEFSYLNGVTSTIQTQLDAKIAKADITAKGVILVGTGSGTYTAQSVGTNGQVLTANSAQEDGVEWTTISGFSAPTLGTTQITSGSTVTTVAGLTLTAPTLTGTVTASGDINLSAAGGPGSLIDELTLILMGAL